MAEIAVIGAGIFGATTSLALAEAGHNVTIFDGNRTILGGTSAASTNRLHIGAHYPRDIPTAIQSLESSIIFQEKFPEAVNDSFPNYYGLVSEASKTNLQQYRHFLNLLSGRARECNVPDNLSKLGLNESELSGFWEIEEGVIDMNVLRTSLSERLKQQRVEIRLDEPVAELIKRVSNGWDLRTDLAFQQFDIIVKATYATDRIKIDGLENHQMPKKYQLTLNLVIESEELFGLTLIDGDFLTIIPQGLQKELIVYAPGPSVLRTELGIGIPANLRNIDQAGIRLAEEELLRRLNYWLPALSPVRITKRLVAVRTLLPDVESTDARPSSVTQLAEDFFEIWSGKLDHAVQIAERVKQLVGLRPS